MFNQSITNGPADDALRDEQETVDLVKETLGS